MTEDEAVAKLKTIHEIYRGDDETIHASEDNLLVEIVRQLGWREFLSVYHSADHQRWCA